MATFKRKFISILLGAASGFVLAGCTIPELGARPEISKPATYATARSFEGAAATWPSDQWWTAYNDAHLTALIDEALAGTPSLAAAAARVRRADAAAQQSESALYPTMNVQNSLQATRQEFTADNLPPAIADALPHDWSLRSSVSARIDYQLDFFGRNRAAIAAATSAAHAMQMEQAAARLQLSTAVALAYADLSRLAADQAAAVEAVRLKTDSGALVRQRRERGLENEGQAAQADSELARAQADLAAIDGNIARARNQIAALLGKGPDRGLDIALPAKPITAPHGLPSSLALDLVGRRPDLAAARFRAEAAASRIDVAHADFYPNVNLTALASFQTLGIERLGGGAISLGQVGPAVSLPIFSGGRLEGAYRAARADYDEAVAIYDQTLTGAIREVADAVSDRRALETQLGHARRALAAAESSYRSMRLRYDNGLASYIDVLTIENGLVSQQRSVAALETRAFSIDVALVRALGGGFVAS